MKKHIKFGEHKLVHASSYGYRAGNPQTDVDSSDKPVQSNYVVLVKVSDCPQTTNEETGRITYNPEGVRQAEKLGYGGTNYGYKTSERTFRETRDLTDVRGQKFWVNGGQPVIEIRMFVVKDGYVYSTRWYKLKD